MNTKLQTTGSHQTTTCQVETGHTWSRDKATQAVEGTPLMESNSLERKIWNMKQDFRQHQRNPSPRPLPF